MKASISKTILFSGILIILLTLSSFTLQKIIGKQEVKQKSKGFAVLELFTSQGCSSCPPADTVLGKYALADNPNIIPLAFHVDYWNYIGWRDPFSKAEFSGRQRDYAKKMNIEGTYTPQLIINGRYELIGSRETAIENKVNEELGKPVTDIIKINNTIIADGKLKVSFEVNKISPTEVVNLALVKKKEVTSIKRGENSGLKQTSYNIVYDFLSLPITKKEGNVSVLNFDKNWLASDFKLVAYIQSAKNGIITGATQTEIK